MTSPIAPGARLRLAVLVATLTLSAPGCDDRTPGTRAGDATDHIPADASFAVVVRDLDSLTTHLEIDSLRVRHGALLGRVGTALRNAVGFDLLAPDSARAGGLDPSRPLAMAMLPEPPGATLLVLPGEPARIIARLEGVYRRRGAVPKLAETHAGTGVHVADRASAAFFGVSDHVLVLSGVSRPDARLARCRALIDGATALAEAEAYRTVSGRLPGGSDLVVYVAPIDSAGAGDLALPEIGLGETLAPLLTFARARGPHRGAGFAARLAPDRLSLASFTAFEDPAARLAAKPPSVRTRSDFLDRLASEPLLALQVNLDPVALLAQLDALRAASGGPATGDTAAAPPGALRRRALETLTGRAGLLANDIALMGTDLVAYAEGTSGAALEALLDSVVTRLRERPISMPILGTTRGIEEDRAGEVDFHRLPLGLFGELCAGVVSDHLVVTTTRARMVGVIEGRTSFLSHVPDRRVREAFTEGRVAAGYVDVAGFSKALDRLPIPQAEEYRNLADLVTMFDHVSLVGDIDDEGYATEVNVVGASAGVWPRLIRALLDARGRTS